MGLMHEGVDPCAGGIVRAWTGKYGVRGGLGNFVAQVLRGASPAPVTTTVLINLAAQHFLLVLSTPLERRNFRKSVRSALAGLLNRKLIEPLHSGECNSLGLWRWGSTLPSIAAMAAAIEGVAAAEQSSAEADGSTNAEGSEV